MTCHSWEALAQMGVGLIFIGLFFISLIWAVDKVTKDE